MTPGSPLPFDSVPIQWLKEQSVALDRMIAAALVVEYGRRKWSHDEVEAGFEELWLLSEGKDCCYDRPSIPFHYASWYHGRRLHDLVSILTSGPTTGAAIHKQVIDLGCGTGSDLWAIGLLVAGLIEHRQLRHPLPLHIIALDASPFMLELAKSLWAERMLPKYPQLQDHIDVTFECSNWARTSFPECSGDDRPLVIANHLMDRSDELRIKDVAESLEGVARQANARSVLIISSQGKAATVSQSIRDFGHGRWFTTSPQRRTLAWEEIMKQTTETRTILLRGALPDLEPRWGWSGARWQETNTPATLRLDWALPEQQGLFAPLLHRKIVLDPDQQKAATPQAGFAKITGVAGSGKTLVLADRIANTLTRAPKDAAPPSIFVTAFNKGVIAIIAHRLEELLHNSSYKLVNASHTTGRACGSHTERDGHFTSQHGGRTVATLMNWDLAISRIFGQRQRADEPAALRSIEHFIDTYPARPRPSWCNVEFIDAEYSRIWYGREGFLPTAYLKTDRRGRRAPLLPADRSRLAALFDALPTNFVGKRIEALSQLLSGNLHLQRFTHVFVDEYQDFSPADFKLLSGLLPTNAPEMVIAGDATQAIHLGAAFRCPPPPTGRWRQHQLVGSYRLPLRICECLEPLSRRVRESHGDESEIETPSPRKSAMLGVRPILIWGETPADRARQICEVYRLYHPVHDKCGEILIAEDDPELQAAINAIWPTMSVESDSMLRCKGLERKFVVWSTRAPMTTDESTEEWAFTLMTRTLAMLVIAAGPDTPPAIADLIRSLRNDRVLWWTGQARDWLNQPRIAPVPQGPR